MFSERFTSAPVEDTQLAKPLRKKSKYGVALAGLAVIPIALLGPQADKLDKICSSKNRVKLPGESVFVAGVPPKDGTFDRTTFFGCSKGYKDKEDNCRAVHQRQIPICNEPGKKPLRGSKCEIKLEYFSANAMQYLDNAELGTKDRFKGSFNIKDNKTKLHTKLKVTNLKNGKSVVVMPIDWGPGCQVQKRESKFDLSFKAYNYIKLPSWKDFPVKVEKIPSHLEKSTPLGPVKKK